MKIRLNKNSSKNSVNKDEFIKLDLKNNTKILPVEPINEIIDLNEQFNKERQNSKYYRISGVINSLFTNVLFNVSGDKSWAAFNNPLFRDRTFPPNKLLTDSEDLTYKESINKHLKNKNGWFGYINPIIGDGNLCGWVDMEPARNKFSLSTQNGLKNWDLTITYPASNESINGDITYNGLLIVSHKLTIIGNRSSTTFGTPVKHGLSQGEKVRLTGIEGNNGIYTVIRTGEDNGDNKEYYFSVAISEKLLKVNGPRMIRIYNGSESQYYFRKFKKIPVRNGNDELKTDDYEIFKSAFSKSIYGDVTHQFIINEDIDITNVKDNLGRPLSEIYLTLIKTDSDGIFTSVKSGILMPFINEIINSKTVPDIREITNLPSSHIPLDTDVKINNNIFYGDVCEYNILELKEKILGIVNHRFNTINRETSNVVLPNINLEGSNLNLESRNEGYIYHPHFKIKLREFSSYIEQGNIKTINLPSYAINVGDGRYLWRDLLDIGINDIKENVVDYPYVNGVHYINSNFSISLKRQDPFNLYGILHTKFPSDNPTIIMNDNLLIKKSENAC